MSTVLTPVASILQALFGAVPQAAANAAQSTGSPRPAGATPPFLPDNTQTPSAASARARINGNGPSANSPQPKTSTATQPPTEKAATALTPGASSPSAGSSAPTAGAASASPATAAIQPATAQPAPLLTPDQYWQKYQQENPGAVPAAPKPPAPFWKRTAQGAAVGLAGGLMNMGTRPGVDPREHPNDSGSQFVSDWVKKQQEEAQAAKNYPLDVAGMKQKVYDEYLKEQGDVAGIGQKQAETGLENAQAAKAKEPAPAKELTPQERALEGYVAQGMSPVEAYRAVLKDEEAAKGAEKGDNTKPETLVMGKRTYQWDADQKKWNDIGPAKETEGGDGNWQLDEGKDGKPILFNPKTAETRPAPEGIEPKGTKAKADAAAQKETEPVTGAQQYANSYLKDGFYTGPGDEALMEKYFELAKPSTGFRMTQPQLELLQQSRSYLESGKAKVHHALTGTWFGDDQRKQIVDTMNELAKAKLASIDKGGNGKNENAGSGLSNFVVNPKTGERLGWNGKAWVAAPKAQ